MYECFTFAAQQRLEQAGNRSSVAELLGCSSRDKACALAARATKNDVGRYPQSSPTTDSTSELNGADESDSARGSVRLFLTGMSVGERRHAAHGGHDAA